MDSLTAIVKVPYRTLTFLALAGLAVFGCMSSGSTRFYTWPWVFYGELLLLAPTILLALDLWRDPSAKLARRTVLTLFAIAMSIGLSTALSIRPQFSLEVALFLWGGVAIAALVARRFTPIEPTSAPLGFIRVAALFLALPILSGAALWIADIAPHRPNAGPLEFLLWLRNQRNPHPAGHWNYTGGLALLALPWLLTLAWNERGRWRALWVPLATITTVVLFSAASRGATLGVIAALLVSVVAFAIQRGLRRRTIAMLAILVLGAGVLLAIANPRVRASLTQGSETFVPTEGDVQRLSMIQAGTRLFLARPIVGHGPGITPFVYPSVRAQLIGGVETSFQLHNAPLQWAVDLGLVGLAAATLLGLTLLAAARQWWLRPVEDPVRPYALASICTLVAYGTLAITDYQLSVVGITVAIGVHLGLVLAGASRHTRTALPKRSKSWISMALLCVATATGFLLTPGWHARELFWSAWWTIEAKDEPAIVARLRAAADAAPWNPHYRTHLGLRLGSRAVDHAGRESARIELERSLAIDPLQEPCQAALGWLWLPDNPAKAEDHFRAALAMIPDRDTLHLGLAFALLHQARTNEAIRALATECVVNPEFVTSPLWYTAPLAPMRTKVEKETAELFAEILAHKELPRWRIPALQYARAFVRWWQSGENPSVSELSGALGTQRAAFNFIAGDGALSSRESPDLPRAILQLAALRDRPETRADVFAGPSTIPVPAIDGALARLAPAPRITLGELLRQPAPDGAGIVMTTIQRGHYAIMQRNIDGPWYSDLCPRTRDSFADAFAGLLYPEHGLIPGPVLADIEGKHESAPSHRPHPAMPTQPRP